MASPPWFQGINLREWGTLPSSKLDTSGVLETGGEWVMDAWGGGVVVTHGLYIGSTFVDGHFLMVWGGGHTDSDLNAIYAYGPYGSNSPQWHRLRDSTSPPPTNVQSDLSGNPVSRHVYQALFPWYDGTRNEMISIGSRFTYIAALSFNDVLFYDLTQVSPNSNLPWSFGAAAYAAAGIVGFEPSSGRAWYWAYGVSGGNHVGFYDPATDTFTDSLSKSPRIAEDGTTSAVDNARGIWGIWDATEGVSFYRTNNGVSNDYYQPTVTGTPPTGRLGMLWDDVDDCFVFGGEGKTIYKLTPPATSPYEGGNAWVWSSETPAGGDIPDSVNSSGTYGRFALVTGDGYRGYSLVNRTSGDAYFFRTGPVVASDVRNFWPFGAI